MNINNNSSISFGLKLNKDLISSLENDLAGREGHRIAGNKLDIKKDLYAKMLVMSSWGDDSFELVETTDKVLNKKGFGLKKVGNEDFIQPMKLSNRRSLLTRFFVLKKEDVERCIAEFDNALGKKNTKNIEKQIIKFR